MHHRIDTILGRIRQDLAHHLDPESIHSACFAVGHTWRQCRLTPVVIVNWFLVQVLGGNTALHHISLLAGRRFTDSAYCQARARLPLAVLLAVLKSLVAAPVPETRRGVPWRGHRTLLIDGSSFSTPDTPALQKAFGQPGIQAPGCEFPTAKILAVFDAATGMLMEVAAAPLRTNDMSRLRAVHPALRPGDVLVGDRGFCSFAHLVLLSAQGVFAAFRLHQRQIVDFTPHRPHSSDGGKAARQGLPRTRWLRSLGVLDQVVEWFKPKARPDWMTAGEFEALPATLIVRELSYRVGQPGFGTRTIILVTTLLDADVYPLEALADLYRMRWEVELNFRHLKTTMKLDVLKCKTVDGVLKELTVYAIVYNLVRVVMMEASCRQGVAVRRVSFVDALRWLAQARPGDDLLDLTVNPHRPNRFEPRAKKRRPKQFDLLNKPRFSLRKDLIEKGVNA